MENNSAGPCCHHNGVHCRFSLIYRTFFLQVIISEPIPHCIFLFVVHFRSMKDRTKYHIQPTVGKNHQYKVTYTYIHTYIHRYVCMHAQKRRLIVFFEVGNLYNHLSKKNNQNITHSSRWWFQCFVIFTPAWGNNQVWLIFFKRVGSATS